MERKLISALPGLDRHVLEPLKAQGLSYVDEIQHMPMKRLCAIVTGPQGRKKLARALGREADLDLYLGKGEVEIPGKGKLTLGTIRQYVGMVGTARHFLGKYATTDDLKEALRSGTVTNEMLADYVLSRQNAHKELIRDGLADRPKVEESPVPVPVQVDIELLDERIEGLIAQYKRDFDTSRWLRSDYDAVRRLAMWEIYAEQTQRLLLSRSGDASFQYAPQLKALSDQVNQALKQIDDMRNAMGVSLKARQDRDKTTEAHEVITDLAERGKRLLDERASIVQCCGIRLDVFLVHFPKHIRVDGRVIQTCPRCGREFEIELVTKRMLEMYVEAGDFVPTGVNPQMFDVAEGDRPQFMTQKNEREVVKYQTSKAI